MEREKYQEGIQIQAQAENTDLSTYPRIPLGQDTVVTEHQRGVVNPTTPRGTSSGQGCTQPLLRRTDNPSFQSPHPSYQRLEVTVVLHGGAEVRVVVEELLPGDAIRDLRPNVEGVQELDEYLTYHNCYKTRRWCGNKGHVAEGSART